MTSEIGPRNHSRLDYSSNSTVVTDRAACFALVVSYNPSPLLVENLRTLGLQFGKIIVIDNGSSPASDVTLREVELIDNCEVIRFTSNRGIAAALNEGVRYALGHGFRWIFTFDQDSQVTPNYVPSMLASYLAENRDSDVAIVAPHFIDANHELCYESPQLPNGDCLEAITAGAMIPAYVFQQIGLFNESLFIDYVDTEFSLRCRRRAYRIITSKTSLLYHSIGNMTPHRLWRRTYYPSNHLPGRRYYIARNRIYLMLRNLDDWRWILLQQRSASAELLKLLLMEKERPAKLWNMVRGAMDGLTGRLGERRELRGRSVLIDAWDGDQSTMQGCSRDQRCTDTTHTTTLSSRETHAVMNSQLPKIFKNAAANIARLGSSWLVLLIATPLLTRLLPRSTYAVWMLVLQFGAYVTMLQGGFENCVGRFVARGESLGDQGYIRQMLLASLFLLSAGAVLLTLITLVVSWGLPWFFRDIPPVLKMSATGALFLVGLCYSFNLPIATFSGYFQGRQRYEVNAFAVTLGRFVAAGGVIWVAFHQQGLVAMALWAAVGAAVQSVILLAVWHGDRQRPALVPIRFPAAAVKELGGFSWSMLVSLFGSVLITGLDLPIVAAFAFSSSGYYAVAATVCSMFIVPYSAILTALLPVAAGLAATQNAQKLGEVLTRVTRYSTSILCLGAVTIVVGMNWFLNIWVGDAYASRSIVLAAVLILAQFVRLTMFPYAIVCFGSGQQARMLISTLAEGIVNLVCSLIAVRIWGALGVALGTLVGVFVGVIVHFLVSIPWTDCISINRLRFFWSGILRPILLTLPPLIVLYFFSLVVDFHRNQALGIPIAFTLCRRGAMAFQSYSRGTRASPRTYHPSHTSHSGTRIFSLIGT